VGPARKYSVWSAEGLSSTFGVGSQWAGKWVAARQAGGGSVGVVACQFFQCIMAWRNLPWARG
jgi:hypothetical protein